MKPRSKALDPWAAFELIGWVGLIAFVGFDVFLTDRCHWLTTLTSGVSNTSPPQIRNIESLMFGMSIRFLQLLAAQLFVRDN